MADPITDYAKESAVIVEKIYDWNVGDNVKINNFYLSNYSKMDHLVEVPAKVTRIVTRTIRSLDLMKEDRALFVSKYGVKDTYDIIGLWIKYSGSSDILLVSPFGYDKIT